VASRNAVDVSNYVINGEWWLLSTNIERHSVVYSISLAAYPDVTVSLHISRRVFYYVLNIIVPCVWLNLLSLLAFCMPPDAGEKVRQHNVIRGGEAYLAVDTVCLIMRLFFLTTKSIFNEILRSLL